MSERRSTRERKQVRQSLNENDLTLEASQNDDDAAEEYAAAPSRRKSRGGAAAAADDEEANGDDGAPKPRKLRARKAAASADVAVVDGGKRVGGRETAAELAEIDRAELPSALYQALAHTKSSAAAIAHEVLAQYRDERKSSRATLALIHLVLAAAGCTHILTRDDLEIDATDAVATYSDVAHQSTIEPPLTRVKGFPQRWIEFWQKLTVESHTAGHLYDETLFPEVVLRWLHAASSSPVRIWRQTSTVAAFAIIEQLNTLCLDMHARIAVVEKQQADRALKKATKATKELANELQQINDKLNVAQDMLKQTFNNIFVHRFRDVSADIRLLCIQQLGSWLRTYPHLWLADAYLKYLGWTLNDKSAEVRLASVESVVALLETNDEFITSKSAHFCQRFSKRLQQMTCDVDDECAAAAVQFLSHQLRLGWLSANDGDDVPPLIWDDSHAVREAAAAFVFDDAFADELDASNHQEDLTQLVNIMDVHCTIADQPDEEEPKRTTRVEKDTISHGAASSSLQRPMDMLVNSFWSRLPALRDYDALTKLILKSSKPTTSGGGVGARKKAAPVDEDRQKMLCHLLASVSKRATGHADDPLAPNLATAKKKDREALLAEAQTFSAHFVTVASQLLTLYQADATKLRILLPIVPLIDLSLYSVLRKSVEFTALLKRLKSIILKHSDSAVLEEAASAMRHLVDSDHALKDEAREAANELATEIAQEWHLAYERAHGSQIDLETDADERLAALLGSLRRITCLQRSLRLPQLQWDAMPDLEKSLNYYAINHSTVEEQQVLVCLMHLGFTTLAWNFVKLQAEAHQGEEEEEDQDMEEKKDEDEEEEKEAPKGRKTRSKRKSKSSVAASPVAGGTKPVSAKLLASTQRLSHSYLSQLELAFQYSDAQSHLVKDVIYRLLADCFVLFSGKLSGTPLAPLAIGPDRLSTLQAEFNRYFALLVDGTDLKARVQRSATDAQREAFLADQRVLAVRDAVKVALFDMNSAQAKDQMRTTVRHRELAGLILARYGSLGDEVDAFLKQFMSGLKAVSTNTLLQAQLESLEYCWRSEVPPVDVRALSLKFVQAHNINPNTRSFAGLLRHGMVFALARAPDNLAFLDVLVPFVQRAGNDDLKAAARMFAQFGTRALAAVEPEDRTEDEWTAVATFADAINKKFGAAVMDVQEHAVVIEAKAAKSIPATPSTPARGGKKRGGDGEGDLLTGALTPMGSPSVGRTPPSSKAARGRRSRVSDAQLGTVAESEEEGDEVPVVQRRRQSAASKKRAHAAVEEEEDAEEDAAEEEEAEPEADSSMETDEPPVKGRSKGKKSAAAAKEVSETTTRRGRKRGAE